MDYDLKMLKVKYLRNQLDFFFEFLTKARGTKLVGPELYNLATIGLNGTSPDWPEFTLIDPNWPWLALIDPDFPDCTWQVNIGPKWFYYVPISPVKLHLFTLLF